MSLPYFSIIIPTLNEEKYLPKLLDSLEKQNEKDFEIIIVDGFSHDKTKEVVLKYKERLSIKFFQIKPNLSQQKNYGAKIARGRYLFFIDADMKIKASFLKTTKKTIEKKKGLVFLPYVLPLEVKEYPELAGLFPLLNRLVEFSQNFNKPFSSGPAMIFERNFFYLIGGFSNVFGEDHDIVRKAYYWGVRAKVFPHNLTVKFSLRRMKKEGRLKLAFHFISAHIYLIFKEKLDQKFFKYEMGGQFYLQNKKRNFNRFFLLKNLMSIVKKVSYSRTRTK